MRNLVRAVRQSEGVFDVATASAQRLTVEAGAYDRPGTAAGPAPMELLLAALVTCSGSTIEGVLQKMRLPVAALNVVADGDRAERPPRVFTDILLEFQVAADAPVDRLERAVEITERTCSVSAMLGRVTEMSTRLIHVRKTEPAETRALRQEILRPHQSIDELAAEEDPAAVWFSAAAGSASVGSVSIQQEQSPDVSEAAAFRLRSMATTPEMRGRGLGRVLLAAALGHATEQGGTVVWCSARVSAIPFYRSAGFVETSEPYDVAHIGPHVRMARRL